MPRLPKPRVHCEGCVGDTWVHPIPPLNRTFTAPHTGFSQGEGHATNGVTCIGEALGQNEDADGLPFRPAAQAGSLLERAFKRLGYSREQFRINNIVRCRPPHDHLADAWYEAEVIRHCRPYLDDELTKFKPRCILALGGTAARELTGLTGAKQGVSFIRGYAVPSILPSALGVPVVSTFHPSFIRQGHAEMFGVLCHDINRAVQIARDGWNLATPSRDYCLSPSIEDVLSLRNWLRDNPKAILAYDIETDTSADVNEEEADVLARGLIRSIQFSVAPDSGMYVPWQDEYKEAAADILNLPNVKIAFNNWHFDDPILKSHGVKINGRAHDLMWAWHAMQPDLPRNLQFVASFYGFPAPWKHLGGSDHALYGIQDVDCLHYICRGDSDLLRSC